MGIFRPAGSTGVGSAYANKYTQSDANETITGNWNFTGTVQLNGQSISAAGTYVASGTTNSLNNGASQEIVITHGLGTDNVICVVAIDSGLGETAEWSTAWMRPDQIAQWSNHSNSSNVVIPTTPSAGTVHLAIRNLGGSATTLDYVIQVRSLD